MAESFLDFDRCSRSLPHRRAVPGSPMANAQAQPFYQGKTIRIVVGFTPGGFYDRWARLLGPLYAEIHPG